jgi:hypothetical protein
MCGAVPNWLTMVVVAKLACKRRSRAQYEPKPCKRFTKRMLLNAKFIAHLSDCDAGKSVVIYRR